MFIFLCCLSMTCVSQVMAQQPTKYCAIVFDFGEVIAKVDVKQIEDFTTKSFNINKEELITAIKDMRDFVAKGGSEKQFWEQFARSKNISLPEDWYTQLRNVIKNSITGIPETIAIIKSLKEHGYQTALLSNATQEQAEIVKQLGYYDLFDPVVLSCDIKVSKPNPEAFKILLEKLHVASSCVLFIDDKLDNVEAAKKLGFDAIQFTTPEQLKRELESKKI